MCKDKEQFTKFESAEQYLVRLHQEQSRQIEDLRGQVKDLQKVIDGLAKRIRICREVIKIGWSDGYYGPTLQIGSYGTLYHSGSERDAFETFANLFDLNGEIDMLCNEHALKKEADNGDKVDA